MYCVFAIPTPCATTRKTWVSQRANTNDQQCPEARRPVVTSMEIKALGKGRCKLIPDQLVTGPAGILTQTEIHDYGPGNIKKCRKRLNVPKSNRM